MSASDLHTTDAQRTALDAGKVSSRELTEAALTRSTEQNDDLGAFLFVDEEGALAAAEQSDLRIARGEGLGPLDGIPIAIKDNIHVSGQPTTAASRILQDYRPPFDATCVSRLRAAGAVLIGKTNCDEFGMGSSTENSAYAVARNPWNIEHSPGGSSGGSAAAVAAGLTSTALGTDTGGSIRQPASFCGVVGLKPTYGRVSRFGVVAFASSLDQVGPIGRSVRDCAAVLSTIAGHDARDATSSTLDVDDFGAGIDDSIDGLRVGVPRHLLDIDGVDDDVRRFVTDGVTALTSTGARSVEVELPHSDFAVATYYIICMAEASSNLARYDGVRFGPRRGEDGDLTALYESSRGELFGAEVKRRILLGTYVLSAGYYDAYYLRAQQVRSLIAADFDAAFADVDVIAMPTSPTTAFGIGTMVEDPLSMYLSDVFTISASLAGLPSISVPVGVTAEGLPVGLQLIGRPFDEATLLRAALAVENTLNLELRPPVG